MRSVRELGYRPNLAASALAAAQHTCIALIYTNPSSSYLRELLVGALRGSARAAAQLVIATWDTLDAEGQRPAARQLAQSVAGVILPPPLCESKAIVAEFARASSAVDDRPVPYFASSQKEMSPLSESLASWRVPASITIKAGQTVKWKHCGPEQDQHTVTSDAGSLLDSPFFGPNGTYTKTFAAAGTNPYHCTPHPDMQGTIIVTP